MKRRDFLGAAVGISLIPTKLIGQAAPRVVIVGGGFAGASCARALKKAEPRIAVTLVESSAAFTACPFSNAVIAGLRDLKAQQFTYENVVAAGIALARTTATAVDPQKRMVTLADGSRVRDRKSVV